MNEFDLLGPLPSGTTLLEASAGTGKTFTIAALVARYVAEGVTRLDELLVVTFNRQATRELRDRVRERLVSARDGLADPSGHSEDELVRHLASREPEVRHRRLVDALATFDSATVATTHGFCEQVLKALGTAGDTDAGAELIENLDDLTVEVVEDLYLGKWARPDAVVPPLTLADATELALEVVHDGQALLAPFDPPPDSDAAVRRSFAEAVRAEVALRKRRRRVLGFDDLLTRLRDTLADPAQQAAARRLRARFRTVLVDEFQDTDPVQWDILREAFHGHAALVLIGDPKQAIYAFRGADVHAYLAASAIADHTATLAQNWRSDPELLYGLDCLFRRASLGDARITVDEVHAAHSGRSLDAPGAPVRLRTVRTEPTAFVDVGRGSVVADLVREIVDLLESRATLTPQGGAPRAVQPGDLAVIVRTGRQLEQVHDALLAAGVPAVRRTTSSVFRTPAAADWIVLLEALEQPHRSARVRRLAITPFVGWDAADLETKDVDRLALRVRAWLAILGERGIAALFDAVSRDERLVARLLAQSEGERSLTDLRHVGEALHSAALAEQLGLSASLEWLRRRVAEAASDNSVERSRRLDSDAAAVQVVTVHASKGLEFPVVYVPFAWDRFPRDPDYPLFHDDSGRRVRNVGGPSDRAFPGDQARHDTEELGEDLRLLYVAMTRAQARVTAWWAPSTKNTMTSALHRLLLTDDPAAGIAERVPIRPDAWDVIASRAVEGCLSVTEVHSRPPARWRGARPAAGPLSVAQLGRTVDADWRRTSYTALTNAAYEAAHSAAVATEPGVGEKDDEPEVAPPDDPRAAAVASPMADLPGGTAFGTLVHAVLEHWDPAGDLGQAVREQVGRFAPDLSPDTLTVALAPALATPLGPLAGDLTLAEIPTADRLTELDFELPLGGGDAATGTARLRDLAEAWRANIGPDDPLADYPDLLEDPLLGDAVLRGYLGGSIDAVLRVGGRYGTRYVVVDYKTNRLGDPDTPLTAWDYRPEAMRQAMRHAHYPLQAMLYTVALHRFLRWRVAGYDPAAHLGGVLYLFLRGMCGPEHPGSGVFAWRPAPALVTAISDALR